MKKVMVLIIAVAMVFTLAGCGKDKKSSKKNDGVEEIRIQEIRVENLVVEEIQVEEIKAERINTENISCEMVKLKGFGKDS